MLQKTTLFKPVTTGASSINDNSHVKELFWCYNYLTSLGIPCTEALLIDNNTLIPFFLDDLAKEEELDLSPALMSLCTMVDQMSQDGAANIAPALTQSVYNFVTSP